MTGDGAPGGNVGTATTLYSHLRAISVSCRDHSQPRLDNHQADAFAEVIIFDVLVVLHSGELQANPSLVMVFAGVMGKGCCGAFWIGSAREATNAERILATADQAHESVRSLPALS